MVTFLSAHGYGSLGCGVDFIAVSELNLVCCKHDGEHGFLLEYKTVGVNSGCFEDTAYTYTGCPEDITTDMTIG